MFDQRIKITKVIVSFEIEFIFYYFPVFISYLQIGKIFKAIDYLFNL